METIKQLSVDGASKGLCDEWQKKITKKSGIKRLSELFIRGIDFCISEDFPTLEFMRENFKGKCEKHGIFIDHEIKYEENFPHMVLNGDSKASLMYDQYNVSQLYVRHNSKVKIVVKDHAILTIDAFDDSKIEIETLSNGCKAIINLYGNASLNHKGSRIKIHKKNQLTY
jgi:hypothetical protein